MKYFKITFDSSGEVEVIQECKESPTLEELKWVYGDDIEVISITEVEKSDYDKYTDELLTLLFNEMKEFDSPVIKNNTNEIL